MKYSGKTVVVTGGASGIGAALVMEFIAAGARVAVFDLKSTQKADAERALFLECDVSDEIALKNAIERTEASLGPVDIFVSNAGVMSRQKEEVASAENAEWDRCWSVNVMAHVYAARILLPAMLARGSGYFVNMASAAGLLNQIGDAAYSATKHAAVSFAESLAISHGHQGIGVSVVCPQYVATPLIGLSQRDIAGGESLLSAQEVALCILRAVEENRFLVLPHPEVAKYCQSRARDHEAWIRGMEGLRRKAIDRFGDSRPDRFYRLV